LMPYCSHLMNGLPQWQNNKPFISVQDNIKGAYYKAPFLMRSKASSYRLCKAYEPSRS